MSRIGSSCRDGNASSRQSRNIKFGVRWLDTALVFARQRHRYTKIFGNERKAATGRSTPKAVARRCPGDMLATRNLQCETKPLDPGAFTGAYFPARIGFSPRRRAAAYSPGWSATSAEPWGQYYKQGVHLAGTVLRAVASPSCRNSTTSRGEPISLEQYYEP